jgi:hypothetical protein
MASHIETFQIHLSSQNADKIIDGNNCNVEFYLPVIEIPSNYHIYASVQHAVIPFTFYNVNSTNNILQINTFNDSIPLGVDRTFTIPIGNYNVNNLMAVLSNQLSFLSFAITYNSVNNTYTFSNSLYNFKFYSSSTCLSLLGFLNQENVSSNFTMTSNRAVNLAPIRCICISSNLKTNNINKTSVNNSSILCSIPINTQPYSIITYMNQNNFKVNTFTNVISTLSIKLADQTGHLLDLNGANWTITLQFEIADYVDNID